MLSVTSARQKPRPTYDELAEEVARLRAILEPTEFSWSRRLKVSPTQARILWLLIQRQLVPHAAIESATLHDRRGEESDRWLDVTRSQISILRRKLKRRYGFLRPPIKNIHGVGYEMDAEYRAIVRSDILG